MFKKLVIAGLAVAAGLFVLRSTHLGAYARTAWGKVKTSAQKQVPLEFQLDTLRNEAAHLIPDMRKNISAIATETVAVQQLREDIVVVQTNLDKQHDKVRVMKEDLKSGATHVVYDGRKYSADRVRDRLARDLDGCKRCSDELKAKEKLLQAREQALEAEKEKLASVRLQKEQIDVQIAQLEAEVKAMRVVQTKSTFQLDDSRLARIKAGIADIRSQMRVEQTENEFLAAFDNSDIPVEKKAKTKDQLIKEAEDYLGDNSELKVEATKTK